MKYRVLFWSGFGFGFGFVEDMKWVDYITTGPRYDINEAHREFVGALLNYGSSYSADNWVIVEETTDPNSLPAPSR